MDRLLAMFSFSFKRKYNGEIKKITVVQLSHIGDLVLTLPALKKIKNTSNYEVSLVVSRENYAIAEQIDFLDHVYIADAPYFLRGKKGTYLDFIKQLQAIKTDVLFDVRGDLRNNIFLKFFTRKKIFAGYEVGGAGPLLDVVLPYPFGQHITNLCVPLMNYLNLPTDNLFEFWDVNELPSKPVDININENYFVVHPGTAAQSRKWPLANFVATIRSISQYIPVYVLGTPRDVDAESMTALSNMPNVKIGVGKYSITESIYITKNSIGFLGLDSGFTHIAALSGVKIFVLFAGMADEKVWKPYQIYTEQLTIFSRKPPCSMLTGCGKPICVNNICMTEISTFEVIRKIELFLLKKPVA